MSAKFHEFGGKNIIFFSLWGIICLILNISISLSHVGISVLEGDFKIHRRGITAFLFLKKDLIFLFLSHLNNINIKQ